MIAPARTHRVHRDLDALAALYLAAHHAALASGRYLGAERIAGLIGVPRYYAQNLRRHLIATGRLPRPRTALKSTRRRTWKERVQRRAAIVRWVNLHPDRPVLRHLDEIRAMEGGRAS